MTQQSNSQASTQTDFFQAVEADSSQRELAELCNALYERELQLLAHHGPSQLNQLQRRLAGLSYHVNRTARFLVARTTPLTLDPHNASWQAKQPSQSPARKSDPESLSQWLSKHAKIGLVLPLRVQEFDNEHIELDSIDKLQVDDHLLHVNKFGWFNYRGHAVNTSEFVHKQVTMVKPTPSTIKSACCGHTWNHKGKTLPRRLSLREILLVSTLDWRHFRSPSLPPWQ